MRNDARKITYSLHKKAHQLSLQHLHGEYKADFQPIAALRVTFSDLTTMKRHSWPVEDAFYQAKRRKMSRQHLNASCALSSIAGLVACNQRNFDQWFWNFDTQDQAA